MERLRRVQQATAVALVLVFGSALARAEPTLTAGPTEVLPKRLLPEYEPCEVDDVRYACFTAEQMVDLNLLEAKARYWHEQWANNASLLRTREEQVSKLQLQINLQLQIEKDALTRIDDLQQQVVTEIQDKNVWRTKAEHPPTWPLWVGGLLGVLGLGAFLGSVIR